MCHGMSGEPVHPPCAPWVLPSVVKFTELFGLLVRGRQVEEVVANATGTQPPDPRMRKRRGYMQPQQAVHLDIRILKAGETDVRVDLTIRMPKECCRRLQ